MRIAIIGAGFSGLGLAIRLKQVGITQFTIYEKAESLGGTWRDNQYPGAACDTPSFAYCYSFYQKTDWSRKWSPQQEILSYLEDCAEHFELGPHLRFSTEIQSSDFFEDEGIWRLTTRNGECIEAEVVVSSVGQLSLPAIPAVPGLNDFEGDSFHTARWPKELSLDNRSVAVVGNAASAIQCIPEIAKQAKQVTIFQRSANWMIPKGDRNYSKAEQQRFRRWPWFAKLYRSYLWVQHELRFPWFIQGSFLNRKAEQLIRKYIRSQFKNSQLRSSLLPDYPVGGKRILISDDYYQAVQKENVVVVTDPIQQVQKNSVMTTAGNEYLADVIIFATGFRTTEFLAPMEFRGRGGRSLQDDWKSGAFAYLGMTVPNYPNLFMLYGPNTNLGHNSIIFMLECQFNYIVKCIQQMERYDLRSFEVSQSAMDEYQSEIEKKLEKTVWSATEKSWYKTGTGRITNNWPSTTTRYWLRTRSVHFDHYEQSSRLGKIGG